MSNTASTTATSALLAHIRAIVATAQQWADEVTANGGFAFFSGEEYYLSVVAENGFTTPGELDAYLAHQGELIAAKEARRAAMNYHYEERDPRTSRHCAKEVAASLANKGIGGFSAEDLARWGC